jgi:hypothetical protein
MMKSSAETAAPIGVLTAMRPEPALAGTVAVRVVGVPAARPARVALNRVWLFARTVSQFVPVIVTLVPATPAAGAKLAIDGAPGAATTKSVPLFADPFGEITEMAPVLAPAGTVTTRVVPVADTIAADVPLNETAFCLAVALKPVP